MARVVQTPDQLNFTKIIINAKSVGLTPDQFLRLCNDNPELEFELTARKEIVIMPPCATETAWQEGETFAQLALWAKRDQRGLAFPSSAGFTLPNGATRAPDAAWISRDKWTALSREDRDKFAPICPDFVIEVKSKRNTMAELHSKMREYIENGSQMGFLIQPKRGQVYIYRKGHAPEQLNHPPSVSGDPVLPGFTLDLTEIWK
jgi:Uma2 family endonuclease